MFIMLMYIYKPIETNMKSAGTLGYVDHEANNIYNQDGFITYDDTPELQPEIDDSEHETTSYDAMSYARDTVDTLIVQSDYFITQALEKGIDLRDTSSTAYLKHMADFTNEYLDQHDTREYFTDIDGGETYQLIRLFGTAPYAIRMERTLDYAEQTGHRDGVEAAKETAVALNHNIFALAQANPMTKINELAEQIDLATSFYDPDARGYTQNVIARTATALRREYSVWDVFHYRPNDNYRIRHGSKAEDRKGIDFVIGLQDGIEFAVDIKSNLNQLRQKQHEHTPTEAEPYTKAEDGKFIYRPPTNEEDYVHGSFKLYTDKKIQLRNRIFEDMQKMAKLL